MISAKDELAHVVSTFSEEEAERALELLEQAGLLDDSDAD
jgi:hypothetical protein